MLTVEGCRNRLHRFRETLSGMDLSAAVVTHPRNVYYLSGYLASWQAKAALYVDERRAVLISGSAPAQTAADEVRTYDFNAIGTLRHDQSVQIAKRIGDLSPRGRLGTEFAWCDLELRAALPQALTDIEPALLTLRRRKDPDELACLRRSAECLAACYRRAAELIAPGLDEVGLYAELQRTAVETAGEPIGRFGNDFQCGTPGGAPRRRPAEPGEIWILDLGVEYRGYAADMSRGFPVTTLTDRQHRAWEAVVATLRAVEPRLVPGASCREIYRLASEQLAAAEPFAFGHHLGHGIGLAAHEGPHLNPHWDEVLEAGDVITVEPGLYHADLRGGIRIENDYVIGEGGAEKLIDCPFETPAR